MPRYANNARRCRAYSRSACEPVLVKRESVQSRGYATNRRGKRPEHGRKEFYPCSDPPLKVQLGTARSRLSNPGRTAGLESTRGIRAAECVNLATRSLLVILISTALQYTLRIREVHSIQALRHCSNHFPSKQDWIFSYTGIPSLIKSRQACLSTAMMIQRQARTSDHCSETCTYSWYSFLMQYLKGA